jgi:multidrug resistance efflux pump
MMTEAADDQDQSTDPVEEATPAPHWQPQQSKRWVAVAIVLAALVAIAAILAAWGLWPFDGGREETENAYLRGRVTVIAPQVSGYVSAVLVRDYQTVRQGQVLARIDDAIYRARVEQAKAGLAAQEAALANSRQAHASRTAGLAAQVAGLGSAQAQLLKARADMARADDLVRDGSIARREYDQTLAALRQAEAQVHQAAAGGEIAQQDIRTVDVGRGGLEAQVAAARAALHLAEIDLSHTVITAPESGQVGEIGVRLGQYVAPGTQFFSLVPPDLWVIANFKEAQTGPIAVGLRVVLSVDALGGRKFKGHVERLSPAAGSEFSVLKPDNATGNFIKVPQRIGVRIAIDPGQAFADRLRPGMSVEARVETQP